VLGVNLCLDEKVSFTFLNGCNFLGEGVVGGGKQQKKKGVVDGKNRRVLGDIGNLANLRGVEVNPNRPITRSFGAQLLANAQAASDENNKKQACANVVPKTVAGQKKKVTVKAKPDKAIHIEASPDKKKEGHAYSKKKSRALTSVLTARSKSDVLSQAACGITKKPKEQVIDIDAGDVDNELAAVEYIDDIYKFYKLVEKESRPHDYIDSQPEINERMRAILVDWLIDVHTKFDLSAETLYLTINIIDRFLAVKTLPRRELQLVGVSAMLIAAKYEEIWPPEVNDFVCLSDRAYTHEQILVMEKIILGKLEWTLTVPTPFVFLVRFIKASVPDQELENMAHFLSELGMMNYATLIYCPSMVAASAVFAARCTLNKAPLWNETLKLHTGYSQEQLMDCARLLVSFHSTVGNGKLKVVYGKYSDPHKGAVAMFPPAKNLLPESGEAVVGGGKQQKKNGVADGRNRKALGDIGNLANLRGVEVKPNRPITRSFGAQLLANAQAAAVVENNKAACGITKKPKEQVIDIDAGDVDNELAAVEYIDDIYKFYKLVENESRPHDYIDSQPEINERMRAILVDWLIDVHTKFDLSAETLYLTINIIDRFLAVKTVPRRELQLVGVSAMLMAAKYEEIWPPEVNDFVCLSDRAYTHEQILVMEKIILGNLEWTLTVPTPFVFLVRFIKASVPDQELENMAHFLSELGMMNYATLIYCPSMVAASAVFAARCTLNKAPLWNETLKLHTGYSEEQLMDCARLLVSFHSNIGNGKLKVVYRKYSDPQKGAVAGFPPAKYLLSQQS
ncbi:hypothetical protein CR513_14627, partial [Mucuna pruriens]